MFQAKFNKKERNSKIFPVKRTLLDIPLFNFLLSSHSLKSMWLKTQLHLFVAPLLYFWVNEYLNFHLVDWLATELWNSMPLIFVQFNLSSVWDSDASSINHLMIRQKNLLLFTLIPSLKAILLFLFLFEARRLMSFLIS